MTKAAPLGGLFFWPMPTPHVPERESEGEGGAGDGLKEWPSPLAAGIPNGSTPMSLDTDYCATTRSNYFRVNDEAAFHAFCETLNLRYWTHNIEPGEKPHYAITADIGGRSHGWPSETWLDNEPVDVDLPAELARFLDPRDVAVLMEVGNDGMRYVNAVATAVRHDGRITTIRLGDIYELAARELGEALNITEAFD